MQNKPYSDARWSDNPKGISPQCNHCKHLIGLKEGKLVCNAYPNGIPDEIDSNKFIHKQSYPGDNGILFTPKESINHS